MNRLVTTCLALLLVVSLAAHAAAADAWWNDAWSCRRSVATAPPQRGEAVCSFAFPPFGKVAEGGADIRVVSGGEVLPRRVISDGREGRCHIAFPVRPGMRRAEVYYGNPDAEAPDTAWTPRRGLLLETRHYTGKPANSLANMRKAFDAARPVHGAGFVDRVFHGYNPFGPTSHYIAAYSGWLVCPQEGEYAFATMASGPTFLAVEGAAVCGRAYWGGPSGKARVRGKVRLKRGAHRFEYFMVHRWGRASAVAAWQPPGGKTFEVIPKGAFPDVDIGRQIACDVRGGGMAPDFTWQTAANAQLPDGTTPIAVTFTDRTLEQAVAGYERQWDFGDGVTASDRQVRHIYTRPGAVEVTLRVRARGRTADATQRIAVDRDWSLQTVREPTPLPEFADAVRAYPFAAMAPPYVAEALELFEAVENWKAFADAARGLIKADRLERLAEPEMTEAALRIARHFRGPIGDPDGALDVLQRAEKAALSPPRKAKLALEAADTRLYYMTDVERAREGYRRLLNDYALADKYVARQAHIRIGDTWAMQGKYDEALAAYKDAQAIKVADKTREHFGIGARAFETEAYLQRKEYDAARDALNAWQWEHPVDKLVGEWSVLKGRLGLATENYAEAVKQLDRLRRANPRSPYVPEALLLLSKCYEAQGRLAEAVGALETLRREYPESLLKDEAAERLERLLPRVKGRQGVLTRPRALQ